MRSLLLAFFTFICLSSFAQLAPDFTVTDTGGKVHKLYADYLDKGKVVVLRYFSSIVRRVMPLHHRFNKICGMGQRHLSNVQFIELTNKVGDTNPEVIGYKISTDLLFQASVQTVERSQPSSLI